MIIQTNGLIEPTEQMCSLHATVSRTITALNALYVLGRDSVGRDEKTSISSHRGRTGP